MGKKEKYEMVKKKKRIGIDIRKFHPGLLLVVLGTVVMTTENRRHRPNQKNKIKIPELSETQVITLRYNINIVMTDDIMTNARP